MNTTGWVLMLSQLDQGGPAAQYKYGMPSSVSNPYNLPFINGISTDVAPANPNVNIYSKRMEILTCPSDTYPAPIVTANPSDPTNFYSRNQVARSNYLFSSGQYTDYDSRYASIVSIHKGMFGNDGAGGLQDCTDGSSNTIAVGEAKNSHGGQTSSSYGPYWGAGVHTCCHGRSYWNLTAMTLAATAQRPQRVVTQGVAYGSINMDLNNDASNKQYAWGFGSYHPGGAQFVMCDGAVKFISQSIAYDGGTATGGIFVWLTRPADNLPRSLAEQ
jgi:prepilin-type processing-associated H-X9-DG protein